MNDRRTFLRQLTTLPLIGGSVALIGSPQAVAEPVTTSLATAYKTWLQNELRLLSYEMAAYPDVVAWYGSDRTSVSRSLERCVQLTGVGEVPRFHDWTLRQDKPSSRAALVLSTVGADWRERQE